MVKKISTIILSVCCAFFVLCGIATVCKKDTSTKKVFANSGEVMLLESDYLSMPATFGSINMPDSPWRANISFTFKLKAGAVFTFVGTNEQKQLYQWAVYEKYYVGNYDSGWNNADALKTGWASKEVTEPKVSVKYTTQNDCYATLLFNKNNGTTIFTEDDLNILHSLIKVEGTKVSDVQTDFLSMPAMLGSTNMPAPNDSNRAQIPLTFKLAAGAKFSFVGTDTQKSTYKWAVYEKFTDGTYDSGWNNADALKTGWAAKSETEPLVSTEYTTQNESYATVIFAKIAGGAFSASELSSLHSMIKVEGTKTTFYQNGALTQEEYNIQPIAFGSHPGPTSKTRAKVMLTVRMEAGTKITFLGSQDTYDWAVVETGSFHRKTDGQYLDTDWITSGTTYTTKMEGAYLVLTVRYENNTDVFNTGNSFKVNVRDLFSVVGTKRVTFDNSVQDNVASYNDTSVTSINHRGSNYLAPENTLEAYTLSAIMGFTHVECDVSFTSDGIPVLLHDDTIDRTSTGTGNIADLTFAQASQYDYGSWFAPEWAGVKLPKFEEFLQLCKTYNLHPYIELKGIITEEQATTLVNLVKANNMQNNVSWISFKTQSLVEIVKQNNTARVGVVASNNYNVTPAWLITEDWLDEQFTTIKNTSNEATVFFDVYYTQGKAGTVALEHCKAMGYPLEVWTADGDKVFEIDPYVTGYSTEYTIAGKLLENATYTVTWTNEDGTITYQTDTELSYGAQISYNSETPTSANGLHRGWYSGSTRISNPDNSIVIKSNLTLKAEFYSENSEWDGSYPIVKDAFGNETYNFGGDGTENNPYLIYDAQDLAALSALSVGKDYGSGKYYKVMANIDLNCGNWRPICDNDEEPGGWPLGSNAGDSTWKAFSGVFDGNGHTITYNETTSKTCFGLFFSLNNATVKNLTFEGTIEKINYVGTVAVLSKGNAIIENVTSNVTINVNTTQNSTTQARVGGIIGQINGDGNKLTNCTNNGNITALDCYIMIGGLCGFAYGNVTLSGNTNNGTITNGIVTASSNYGERPNYVGNLIGNYNSYRVTVTWDVKTNGGVWSDGTTENKTTTAGYGDYVTAPDTATKARTPQYNYTLAGWATKADGSGTNQLVAKERTHYAIFNQEINVYNVTWKVEGQEDTVTQVAYGDMPIYDGTPEKQDYTFKGWSSIEGGNVIQLTAIWCDTTYYAIFYQSVSVWDGTYPDVTLGYHFDGSGSYSNPFLIYTAQDLAALSALSRGKDFGEYLDLQGERADYHYKVMADIDLSCGGWIPICNNELTDKNGKPILGGWQVPGDSHAMTNPEWHVFMGNFDGNGHTITFNETNLGSCYGLFIGLESAIIQNVNFAGSISGLNYLSCVSPLSKGWLRIENVTSSVNFTLNTSSDPQGRSGAIIGQINQNAQGGTRIINCKNTGNFIIADSYTAPKVGGLIGFGYTGLTLESNANGDCANTGVIQYASGTILNDVGNSSADFGIYPIWVGNLVGDHFSNKIIATWVVDTTEETTETLTFGEGYGQLPKYKNASGNASPTKTTEGNYAYQFMGWSLTAGGEIVELTPIITPKTYYAIFEKTFTITISGSANGLLNGSDADIVIAGVLNGTVLDLSVNPITIKETIITASPIADDAQYSREFAYWTNDADAKITTLTVSDNATIKAYFNLITNKYTITWKNYDDEVLLQTEVAYGDMPEYTGETPVKPATNKFTYSFTGWSPEVVTVTNDAIYTAQFRERAMLAVSLSLKGTVGINFYMNVSQYTTDENAYIALTYNHNMLDYEPDIRTSVYTLDELTVQDDIYRFSISFASGQIAENIKLELFDSNGVLKYEMPSYTIMKYCEDMIGSSQDANLVNLCKSLINYGISAMNYFTDYESDLANPTEHIQTLDNAPTQVPQNISGSAMTEGATYLSFVRYSFLALSDTSIRIYFNIANNFKISAYNVSLSYSCESTMAYKVGGNDYGYFVEIYGIESTNISELFTVTLTSKFDSSVTTITYSALHYLSKVYNETENENLKAMCLAIYHYNAYARAYFYGGNPWEIV